MKKIISVILLCLMLVGMMIPMAAAESELPFSDVKEKRWSYEYILTLFNAGIINGRSDTVFAPTENVTRAEFVKMLGGIAGIDPTAYKTSQFTDVSKKAWYAGYVAWAVDAGVTTGMTPTTFAPANNITREQMAAMIYRYAQSNKVTLPNSNPIITFKDQATIATYAVTAVRQMQRAGIISGVRDASTGAYSFHPKDNATREQSAKMLCVLYDQIILTRRAELFALIRNYVENNANGHSTQDPTLPCLTAVIGSGINETGDPFSVYFEVYYDTIRDEVCLTHIKQVSTGLKYISTICLPRDGGESYYSYSHTSHGTDVIWATGFVNAAKLGRGDYDFHFDNASGTLHTDPIAVRHSENTFVQNVFEAVSYLDQSVLPTVSPDYSTRDLGFAI